MQEKCYECGFYYTIESGYSTICPSCKEKHNNLNKPVSKPVMNEYTYQIWGCCFSESPRKLISTEVVIAKDCVEAMKEAKKAAARWNYSEIRDFRKL